MKRSFIYSTASFFVFLCIVFVPFPFAITRVQREGADTYIQLEVTNFLFGDLIGFVSKNIFGRPLVSSYAHSDMTAMYVLVLLLFILAVVISMIVWKWKKWPLYKNKILRIIYMLVCYYLALQLLKYGLDKVFKNQFYLPEPNTLYTPLGNVPRDLLYWSSISTSHSYNVFLGSTEIIAALLLLVKRTRLVGLLLSLFIMLNVLAVNFGFDISVKLFSLLLLFYIIYLLAPYIKSLCQFFFSKIPVTVTQPVNKEPLTRNRFLSTTLKWFAIGIILLEAFYPFIRAGNFNGDNAERPYMHGAYEVKQFISGTDTLESAKFPVKRFFIHKDSYMIFQDQDDAMVDYKLVYDKTGKSYALVDYQERKVPIDLVYHEPDSVLTLQYFKAGKLNQLTGKALDWRKMPALKKEFHWTVDEQ